MTADLRQDAPSLPLSDIRVLSFAQMAQGPATAQLLADLGARVIKVERLAQGALERSFSPGEAWKDGESLLYHSFNRNVRSLAVDLKGDGAREVITKLVEQSDVVIENFRPGVMDGLGLGYRELSELNPGLVYLSATGFGPDGPYRARPGQDLILQAMSGLAAVTGSRTDPPIPAGAPVVDLHAAALNAFSILAALWQRQRTGQGQKVDTNLFEAAVHLQAEGIFFHANGVRSSDRSSSALGHPYSAAPYGIYQTRDGWIAISNSSLDKLAHVLDAPELASFDATSAVERRDEIQSIVQPIILEKDSDDWLELLLAEGVWSGPVHDYDQLLEDPQFAYNGMLFDLDSSIGTARHLRSPGRYSTIDQENFPRTPPPTLGEHTHAILREAGFGDDHIESLISRNVVST